MRDGLEPERPTCGHTIDEAIARSRPCVFVSCKHHLFLDVDPETGSIKLNRPDLEGPDQLGKRESCSLDIGDAGGSSLQRTGQLLNVTRERIRQIEGGGMDKLRELAETRAVRDDMIDGPARYHLPIVPSDSDVEYGDVKALRKILDQKFPEPAEWFRPDMGRMGRPMGERTAKLMEALAKGPAMTAALAHAAGYSNTDAASEALARLRASGRVTHLQRGWWGLPGAVMPPEYAAPLPQEKPPVMSSTKSTKRSGLKDLEQQLQKIADFHRKCAKEIESAIVTLVTPAKRKKRAA